ncbi:hypothetical protein SLEP1_g44255 [Rubroshorea leprosula]|uniref:Uncharacterized protein n=1 Tax=Rubroshorea leprosula TaxID=152421 RepID=A0AAV5LFL9_9ROSI|nr:hypothetical protein SLEP1_g44255 [Rubroshorea leprosula]
MSLFRLSNCFNHTHMARRRLGQKRHSRRRTITHLLQEKERMERKIERMRARTKRLKKSEKKAEVKLGRIQNQFEEVRIANRQAHQRVYQENAFTDILVLIYLAIFEAVDAGDFLTDAQLAQTLRDMMPHGDEENQDSDDEDYDD